AWAATPPVAPPVAAPALASSSSTPVRLVQPDIDPNKRQERVSVSAPDAPPEHAGRPSVALQNGQEATADGVR
ncbi:hypothetical protein, partial [Acinetobacter baumannii]|uniref:hypothetical protein n=1 Tax=Acinetobacter baumannii TaxID=470 RepID=UPI001C090744